MSNLKPSRVVPSANVVATKSHTSEALLTEQQTAEILKIKPSALQVWRSTGRYSLPFIKVGSLVRYRESDIRQWLADRTHIDG